MTYTPHTAMVGLSHCHRPILLPLKSPGSTPDTSQMEEWRPVILILASFGCVTVYFYACASYIRNQSEWYAVNRRAKQLRDQYAERQRRLSEDDSELLLKPIGVDIVEDKAA